jgi:hypothetical protein
MTGDLDGMAVFVAVAEARGFRYYPHRRHASPALRALVDYLRRRRKRARSEG